MSLDIRNCDCMEMMAEFPDKYFDLAIVDPPYGLGESRRVNYHPNASTKYKPGNWDNNIPDQNYFFELFRVSKNQIIWGSNYYYLPPCKKPIIWDKIQPEGIDQAMFEMAWNSQDDRQAMIYRRSPSADKNCISNGDSSLRREKMRIHPTQKPVALYRWLLHNYAKEKGRLGNTEGDKILDTHLGSGSIAIACHYMGFELTACEIDKDYYDAAVKRIHEQTRQLTLI